MSEALAVFGQAIGALYVLLAMLAVRKLRVDWLLDRALAKLTLKPTGGKLMLAAVTGFAIWYGLAGLALLLRSRWAVWMLAAGLLVQAAMIARLVWWRREPIARSTVHASGFSLLAFTVAAIAAYAGKLG